MILKSSSNDKPTKIIRIILIILAVIIIAISAYKGQQNAAKRSSLLDGPCSGCVYSDECEKIIEDELELKNKDCNNYEE